MKNKFFVGTALVCLTLVSCGIVPETQTGSKRTLSFSLVSWNLQTFFDGETTGTEYADFMGSKSSWSRDKYRERLVRLCDAIKIFDADILAFEEIENEAIIRDITNELNGHLPRDKLYPFACFAKKPGTSIGCAVLSRFPIASLTVHQCDWRKTIEPIAPEMRPIMEVTISVSERAPPIRLFVNHWKSKSGGEEAAAFWQSFQESVLARRIGLYPDDAIIACGDFNRSLEEFTPSSGGAVTLVDELGVTVDCKSGWLMFPSSLTGSGSYFYQNNWETIDHIFTTGKASLASFSALSDGPWARAASAGAIPFRYVMTSGTGYSDHLPVCAIVEVR
jgi:endonuclease/exonuclease/phosphatase family metal-dependent hydrolase